MNKLNLATELNNFNRKNGIMICGLNWGLSKKDQNALDENKIIKEDLSYFFDSKVNNYPYRNRIITWFKAWGYEVNTEKENAKEFELSFIQTNWINSRSSNLSTTKKSILEQLLEEDNIANFEYHIEELQPKVIIFLSCDLLRAVNSVKALNRIEKILGKSESAEFSKKDFTYGRQFFYGKQIFEKCKILALPHPTSSRGLKNDYIKLLKNEVEETLSN